MMERVAPGSGRIYFVGDFQETGQTSLWNGLETAHPASVPGTGLDDPCVPVQPNDSMARSFRMTNRL